MIDFIYIIIVLIYTLLVLSFAIQEYVLAMLAGIGMIVAGVYISIYGAGSVINFLTQAFGIINIGLGAYILIGGSIEKLQEGF